MFAFSLLIATPPAKIKNFGHLPLHRGGFSVYLVGGAYGGRFVNRPYELCDWRVDEDIDPYGF